MAEPENQAGSEPQVTHFELEQSDDYSCFMLSSRPEILAVLRSLIQKGAMITVHFDRGYSFLLTSMIALSPDNSRIVLDIGSNDEMNRKALLARKLILTTLVDKVKVQFSVERIEATLHEGRAAFSAKIPTSLLRLQRREFYRLAMPVANPVRLSTTLRLPDGSALQADYPLLDISGGGGLMVTTEQAELLQRGDVLHDCRMVLPEEGLLAMTLSVRNKFDVSTRTSMRFVRVGCEYVDMPPARLSMVHRYITRVERERKARLSGMG